MIEVRVGQVIEHKNFGRVVFQGLDFYMGECTAILKGIDYPGTYYPKIEVFEEAGFKVVSVK